MFCKGAIALGIAIWTVSSAEAQPQQLTVSILRCAVKTLVDVLVKAAQPPRQKAIVIDSSATFAPIFRSAGTAVDVPPPMMARVLDGMKLTIDETGKWTLTYRMEVIGRHDVSVAWRLKVVNDETVLATICVPRKHIDSTDDQKPLEEQTHSGTSDALRRAFETICVAGTTVDRSESTVEFELTDHKTNVSKK